jgi:hypothetical protein
MDSLIEMVKKYGDLKYSAGIYDTKATNAGGPKIAIKYRDLANHNKELALNILIQIEAYSGDGIFPTR